MNIGIFTDTYFPQISGVATSVKMLEKELNKMGHKVYIFTTTDPDAKNSLPRLFRLPSMPFAFFPSRRVAFLYPPKLLLSLKKFELDVIHTQTEFPLGVFGKVVSEFYKLPLVHTYHTMYEDYVHYVANGHLLTPKMAKAYSRFFCNRADYIVTPVEKSKQSLINYGVKKPISVIPTGLDFRKFEKENYSIEEVNQIKKELNIDLNDPIVLCLGRVSKEKSCDVIVKEMPKLLEKIPNAKLIIVGDGPLLSQLKTMVINMELTESVIFTGSRPWEEIGKYYQLGDIFVSASTSETQGLTYIEAMAAKIPLVVKKDDSLEGIISHKETGYFFENSSDFADVAFYALQNKEESLAIAQKGYESIQQLSAEQFAKNILNLYEEVIAGFQPKISLRRNIREKLKIRRKP